MYVGNHADDPPPWVTAPRHLLPGTAPTTALLARTNDTAVALAAVRAYPTGVEITLAVRTRRPALDLFDQVSGRSGRADHLHLAITFPDGTTATADDLDGPPTGPVLLLHHSSGTDDAVDATLWLWPLPTAGTLQIRCTWPARGIDTTTEVDAGPILDAAARTIPLWDPAGADGRP